MRPLYSPKMLSALLALFASTSAFAQNATWTNTAATGNWTLGTNWDTGTAPSGNATIATFGPTLNNLTVTNNATGLVLAGISTNSSTNKTVTISSGSILLQSSLGGAPTITLANGSGFTLSSTLTGTQGFTFSATTGNPRFTLSGANTGLSGNVTLLSGSLVLGNNSALGTGTVYMNGGTLNSGTVSRTLNNDFVWNAGNLVTFDTGVSNSTFRVNGNITLNNGGTGLTGSTVTGNGTQTFIFAGTVSGSNSSFTHSTSQDNGTNSVYSFLGSNSFSHNITVSQGGSTPTGSTGKSGSLGILVGSNTALGTATVTSSAQRFFLASADANERVLTNNFVWQTSGQASATALNAYTLNFGEYTRLTTSFTTNGTLGGTGNITIGNLVVNASTQTNNPAFRRINVTNSTVATINGVFSNNGTLSNANMFVEKTGTGTLRIGSGTHTYAGNLTVSDGTLILNGTAASVSALTVSANGTFGGTGTIGGAAIINGKLSAGDSVVAADHVGKLTFNSSLTINSGGNSTFDIKGTGRGTTYDAIDVGGNATFGGTLVANFGTTFESNGTYDFDLFNVTGTTSGSFSTVSITGSYTITLDSGNSYTFVDGLNTWSFNNSTGDLRLVVSSIPEPSTIGMLVGALALGCAAYRRRRQG